MNIRINLHLHHMSPYFLAGWAGRHVINFGITIVSIFIYIYLYSWIHRTGSRQYLYVYKREKERLRLCNPHTTIYYISLPGEEILYFRFYSSELVTPPRSLFIVSSFIPSCFNIPCYPASNKTSQQQHPTCHDWLQSKSHTYFCRVRREYT